MMSKTKIYFVKQDIFKLVDFHVLSSQYVETSCYLNFINLEL
jgi:hypothetical protein